MKMTLAFFALCILSFSVVADDSATTQSVKKLRIALVGDSTVTDRVGWGVGFKAMLNDNVECVNFAQAGRSSKSFRNEGHWDKAMAQQFDYILIQFGHNDQPGKGPERETDVKSEFPANMKRYVEEARAKGMKPILLTSLTRRRFKEDGKIHSDLLEYADATKQVAKDTNTPLIDLHALSIDFCNSLGKDGCNEISPTTDGKVDATHLNHDGSIVIGKLVAEDLVKQVPELAPYIKTEGGAK